MTQTLLTYKQVARRWKCSVRSVERAVAQKKLAKTVLHNRTVRFRPSAVERAEAKLTEEAA